MQSSIAFASRHQTLDGSLVLLSEGIPSVIDHPDEEHGWQLLVRAEDHQRALDILSLYHTENKQGRWRQSLPYTRLILDWRSLAWFVFVTVVFILGETRFPNLTPAGLMDSQAVRAGEWWRLFTAVSLHGDLHHLLANISTGVLFLGLAMGAFGSGNALLATYLAGAGANLVALFVYPDTHRGLGASGMVMAALGLLSAQSLAHLRSGLRTGQLVLRGLCGGVLLLVLFGFNPSSDIVAHIAGFLLGALLGGLAAVAFPTLPRRELSNRISELLCACLVCLTWYLALR